QQLQLLHQSLIDLQTSLHTDGTALIGHRTALLETVSQLTALGWSVAPHGTVSVQAGSALDQYARISPANAMRVQQLAATHTVVVARLLGEFDAADRPGPGRHHRRGGAAGRQRRPGLECLRTETTDPG